MSRYDIWASLGFTGNPYDQGFLPASKQGAALFWGRQVELTRTQMGVGSGGSHVSIEGDAGVGKTSLARVAAYDMLQQGLMETNGSLFVPVEASIQLGADPVEFEREVWRCIANALLHYSDDLRRANLSVPELSAVASWLNSPTTFTGGSLSMLSFGASGGSAINTSSGFSDSGFISVVRRELDRVFPSSAAGGVVCILDNLELLQTSQAARASLETIRSSLLEVPAVRWILVGSKGIITSARSPRLSGFIDTPIRLEPLSVDEGVELVRRRLEYWGTIRAQAPVQPEDFRYLYRSLGLNLRDSLHLAQQFAKHYAVQFVGTGQEVVEESDRPLYFQSWLSEQADLLIASVSGAGRELWRRFGVLCDSGGTTSVTDGDELLSQLEPLRQAQLLDVGPDPARVGTLTIAVTANGWLCNSARPRSMSFGVTTPGPVDPNGNPAGPTAEVQGSGVPLPDSCDLVDVLDLGPLSAERIAEHWTSADRCGSAAIGLSPYGTLSIDLRLDGPHALVAGTSGAGKSELLQTILTSLAVANRPDEMTFLLIDYKGGAAFADCIYLPHTVGLITDLDPHLAERTLRGLRAELRRRESVLAASRARDIDEYDGEASLPRLLIVVDEVAALVRELPSFVDVLVDVAQRGRSLGIHLLLATQRPTGVISASIRAHTNLRMSLRTLDATDSTDVLGSPAAAKISRTTPGRGLLRVGPGALVPFQTARVRGHLMARSLIDAIVAASHELGIPAPLAPVLPPLPHQLVLSDLITGRRLAPRGPELPLLLFGLEDHPDEQRQVPATMDLARLGHLAIAGAPRTGRSEALRTLGTITALLTDPDEVHVYALDCGNGSMLPLSELPHCGAVVPRTQPERAARLIARLTAEIARRYEFLMDAGCATINEQRAGAPTEERLPHILVLIDRWEGFLSVFDGGGSGDLVEQVMGLLREGGPVGVHVVITGDRHLLSTRIGALIEDRIALRLPDRADFSWLAGRIPPLPDDIPPGRGFRSRGSGDFTELQMALVAQETGPQAQASVIRSVGTTAASAYAELPRHRRPFRVDALPGRISFEDAWALRGPDRPRPLWAMVGVGGDETAAVGIDLARTATVVVAGPPGSGVSTALRAMAESLLLGGTDLVVAAPLPSPLRTLAGRDGVRAVFTGIELTVEVVEEALASGTRPVVLFVDDGEFLRDVSAGRTLAEIERTCVTAGRAIVLGGRYEPLAHGFAGWTSLIRGHQSVLLNPSALGPSAGALIGAPMPRRLRDDSWPAGRALANLGGGLLVQVQVPMMPVQHDGDLAARV